VSTLSLLYLSLLLALGVFGLHRLALLARRRWPERASPPPADVSDGRLPSVTVQLPLFNERTVAEQLLRAVGRLHYPNDRLELQVLDDSTDETRAIVDAEAARLRASGLCVEVVRRAQREGFKAGALREGMRLARGELLCIFDADFAPEPDFLLALVPHFADPGVGMVQARWGHANRDARALTRAQATLLDGHFLIEHVTRHQRGLFFNFNGTAGIWRRSAIEAGGGWEHDTLTEDLDLSYRAQLAGWRFVYRPDVVAPAELPPDLLAFRSQQRRWAKGSVQVGRKLLGRIWRAPIGWRRKLEATAHLVGNAGYPFALATAVALPLAAQRPELVPAWAHLAAFFGCTCSVILFYERAEQSAGRALLARLRDVVYALALGVGMSLGQSIAVLQGFTRHTGTFERTPKRGAVNPSQRYVSSIGALPGLELALAAWSGYGLVQAARAEQWAALPFLALFAAGFGWVGLLGAGEAWHARATRGELIPARRAEVRSVANSPVHARARANRTPGPAPAPAPALAATAAGAEHAPS
jgi:cellulose synthase/poly-beta-1,6-N-acetylglucosamine synthase-like glycosyltransferase